MKGKIILMSLTIILLCINACKTQEKSSANKASTDVSNVETDKGDVALVEKYWKLIELNGNPLVVNDSNAKEAHIILKSEGNRFNGHAGCNRITGSYQTKKSGGITFSQTVATRMMCLNMDTETQFLKVLETADSYTVQKDTLVLSKGKAPLARFVVVYLK